MNKTIVAILAAVMLIAFGYTAHSVKAAGSYDRDSRVAADRDRNTANPSRTDNLDQARTDREATDRNGAQTGATASTDVNRRVDYSAGRAWADQHQVEKMLGKDVKNSRGDNLGSVKDFIVDEQGRIDFAIVSHGGFLGIGATWTVVPYEALSFDGKGNFALNMTKDQLAAAPRFDNQGAHFSDRAWTDQVYRYYGVQPRWSDSGFSDQSMGSASNLNDRSQLPSGSASSDMSNKSDHSGMGAAGSSAETAPSSSVSR